MATKKRTISPEKKEEYRKSRKAADKERQQRWKEEKNSPAADHRRLAFLRNIIYKKGYTLKEAALNAGITPAGVQYCINYQDDIFVSQIFRLLEGIGVECRLEMHKVGYEKGKEPAAQKLPFVFRGDLAEEATTKNAKTPDYIAGCTPDKTLHFLAQYYTECNENITRFCERHGMYRVTLISNFRHDDIKLSTLCSIAEKGNAELTWYLNDKKEEKTEEKKEEK